MVVDSQWVSSNAGDDVDAAAPPGAPGAVDASALSAFIGADRGPGRRTVLHSTAFLAVAVAGGLAADPAALSWGVRVERGSLRTDRLPGREVRWRLAVPPQPRGLVVALHGKDGDAGVWFDVLGAAKVARRTGLAVAAVDGGRGYWHPRAASDTPGMVVHDLLPRLAERGMPTTRIGLTGVSMGGYGALWLAGELGPERVFGVATMCAALRTRFLDTSAGAFDDAADFDRNSIFARLDRLHDLPVHLACGVDDRFYAGNRALARRLPAAESTFDEGGHTTAYCRAHWPGSMEWLARLA